MQAMFSKYDMDLGQKNWPFRSSAQVPRVEKQIKMRVRVVCHACRSSYSSSRACPNCHHRRCQFCARHPTSRADQSSENSNALSRDPDDTRRSRRRRLSIATEDSVNYVEESTEDEELAPSSNANTTIKRPKQRKQLPMQSIGPNGRTLVRADARQRARRKCCRCQLSFSRSLSNCSGCNHEHCDDCTNTPSRAESRPRDSPTRPLTSDSNPDVLNQPLQEMKIPQFRTAWRCHDCRRPFAEGEDSCSRCGHERCGKCQLHAARRERHQVYLHPGPSFQNRLPPIVNPFDDME